MKFKLPPPVKPCVAEVIGAALGELEACGLKFEPGGIDLAIGKPIAMTIRVTTSSPEQFAAVMGYVSPGVVKLGSPL